MVLFRYGHGALSITGWGLIVLWFTATLTSATVTVRNHR